MTSRLRYDYWLGIMMTESWVQWVIGIVVIILLAMISGFIRWWYCIESRQDEKLDKLDEENSKAHGEMHRKMDEQHSKIRDKLEDIWKHLLRRDNDE